MTFLNPADTSKVHFSGGCLPLDCWIEKEGVPGLLHKQQKGSNCVGKHNAVYDLPTSISHT